MYNVCVHLHIILNDNILVFYIYIICVTLVSYVASHNFYPRAYTIWSFGSLLCVKCCQKRGEVAEMQSCFLSVAVPKRMQFSCEKLVVFIAGLPHEQVDLDIVIIPEENHLQKDCIPLSKSISVMFQTEDYYTFSSRGCGFGPRPFAGRRQLSLAWGWPRKRWCYHCPSCVRQRHTPWQALHVQRNWCRPQPKLPVAPWT